jgi:hypothetical protein
VEGYSGLSFFNTGKISETASLKNEKPNDFGSFWSESDALAHTLLYIGADDPPTIVLYKGIVSPLNISRLIYLISRDLMV